MYNDNYRPPCFEYVDLWQYSDDEIIKYIHLLTEYIIDRKQQKEAREEYEKNNPKKEVEMTMEDIPF